MLLTGIKVNQPVVEVSRSLCDFSEFKVVRLVLQPDVIEVSRRENTCWEKPSVSVVKINCDTSVRGEWSCWDWFRSS